MATNRVEHGAVFTPNPGCEEGDEPTGDASAGDGRKCGRDACIAVSAAVGCGMDSGGWKIINSFVKAGNHRGVQNEKYKQGCLGN